VGILRRFVFGNDCVRNFPRNIPLFLIT
jgi:hypothetical protein